MAKGHKAKEAPEKVRFKTLQQYQQLISVIAAALHPNYFEELSDLSLLPVDKNILSLYITTQRRRNTLASWTGD